MVKISDTAQHILEKRYLLKDKEGEIIEDPDGMFRRVAKHVASVETDEKKLKLWEDVFYKSLINFDFMPNSPTLMNAGKELNQLAACFVLPIEDSMEEIFDAAKYAALVNKSGGGTGFSFDKLRPKNSLVGSTSGVASGPVSFMELFNTATDIVKQGGTRRGANMGVLRVDHPDILEFVNCKKNDDRLANFNISVGITDDFMAALANSDDYNLIDPRTGDVAGSLNAEMVFENIIQNAWGTGDPGMIFIDKINKRNTLPGLGPMAATNPSLKWDTKIIHSDGVDLIKDLDGKTFNIVDMFGNLQPAKCFYTGKKPLVKISLEDGSEYYCTKEHKWPVLKNKVYSECYIPENYERVTTDNLNIGDFLPFPASKKALNFGEVGSYDDGFIIGWNLGDGHITNRKDRGIQYGFTFSYDDMNNGVMDKVLNQLHNITGFKYKVLVRQRDGLEWGEVQVNNKKLDAFFKSFSITHKKNGLNETIINSSDEFRSGLIDALFSSDGYVDVKGRLIFTSAHERLIYSIKELLGFYGIKCRINKSVSKSNFPNSKDYKKEYTRYDLSVGKNYMLIFRDIFELTNSQKNERLISVDDMKKFSYRLTNTKIIDMEFTDIYDDVYDISVFDDNNIFQLNQVVTGNCGEQPLLPFEACNLGSINLSNVYDEKENSVDWGKLHYLVALAVRFLDNVIDAGTYPLPQITEMVKANRKIGLGVMGFADLLYQLRIPYNSEEATDLAQQIMGYIDLVATETSRDLAEEKGSFPNIPKSVFKTQKMRNATLTTIAPTGTISMIAGCSGGIEPVFGLAYSKNVMDGQSFIEVNPFFKAEMEKMGLYTDDLMREVAQHGTIAHMDNIPQDIKDIFVTAHDIDPLSHINMLAAFQLSTDNAVSKTINLPNSATVEDIRNCYMLAYESGCKGVTVYRDGSKANQVLTTVEQKVEKEFDDFLEVFENHKAGEIIHDVSLPSEYPAKGYILKSEGSKFYIHLAFKDRKMTKPFAIFASTNNVENSILTFNALDRLEELGVNGGLSQDRIDEVKRKFSRQSNVVKICRMLGFLLRHNVAILDIIKAFDEVEDAIPGTFVFRIKKFLSGFLPDSIDEVTECPECKQNTLTFQEGCKLCTSCGYSACS